MSYNINSMIDSKYKDALFNLTLLPKADNNKKKDKAPNEIDDTFLRQDLVRYTGISESKFNDYSDISNIENLKNERLTILKDVFGALRLTELSN